MKEYNIGDWVKVTQSNDSLISDFVNTKIHNGGIYKITDISGKKDYQLGDYPAGWVGEDGLERMFLDPDDDCFNVGDKVAITNTSREELDGYAVNPDFKLYTAYTVSETREGACQLEGDTSNGHVKKEHLAKFVQSDDCDSLFDKYFDDDDWEDVLTYSFGDDCCCDDCIEEEVEEECCEDVASLDWKYEYYELLEHAHKMADKYDSALKTIKEMSKLLDSEE